jgi:uncharacterized protein
MPMESITREDLELMIELQSAETELSSMEAVLEKMPAQAAAFEKELDDVTRLVEAGKIRLDELKKKYRALETDFEASQERVKKRRTQLDSVKTNKDYQALLKEIEEVKEAGSRIEDDMLQCLDDIEEAESVFAAAQKVYSDKKKITDGKKREMDVTASEMREKMVQLKDRVQALAEKLDPKLKKKYYNIKSKSGGVAIVSVNDAVCKGCHLNIPPQLYNELHKEDEIRVCPHCYRMIYVL